MIERRAFISGITLGLLAAPLVAGVQQSRVYKISYVDIGGAPTRFEAFRQGLRELGWVEGQTITLPFASRQILEVKALAGRFLPRRGAPAL